VARWYAGPRLSYSKDFRRTASRIANALIRDALEHQPLDDRSPILSRTVVGTNEVVDGDLKSKAEIRRQRIAVRVVGEPGLENPDHRFRKCNNSYLACVGADGWH